MQHFSQCASGWLSFDPFIAFVVVLSWLQLVISSFDAWCCCIFCIYVGYLYHIFFVNWWLLGGPCQLVSFIIASVTLANFDVCYFCCLISFGLPWVWLTLEWVCVCVLLAHCKWQWNISKVATDGMLLNVSITMPCQVCYDILVDLTNHDITWSSPLEFLSFHGF